MSKQSVSDQSLPNDGSTDEAILDRKHVWILLRICDTDVCELDVEILIHTVQGSCYAAGHNKQS